MNKDDLMLILQNPGLTKVLLDVLSKDNTDTTKHSKKQNQDSLLESFIVGSNQKPIVPDVVDLRNDGHRAASQFANDYHFPMGKKFSVWFTGHESSLRQALWRVGLDPKMSTLMKNKKYSDNTSSYEDEDDNYTRDAKKKRLVQQEKRRPVKNYKSAWSQHVSDYEERDEFFTKR